MESYCCVNRCRFQTRAISTGCAMPCGSALMVGRQLWSVLVSAETRNPQRRIQVIFRFGGTLQKRCSAGCIHRQQIRTRRWLTMRLNWRRNTRRVSVPTTWTSSCRNLSGIMNTIPVICTDAYCVFLGGMYSLRTGTLCWNEPLLV